METISIEIIKEFNEKLLQEINSLLLHLNPSSKTLHKEDLELILKSSTDKLFVAKDKGSDEVVGMITLIIYRIPFTKKGILEDFVVDPRYRGKGLGTSLVKAALDEAKKEGINYVDLTSKPDREAANKMYEGLGFEKRDTNVFRVNL